MTIFRCLLFSLSVYIARNAPSPDIQYYWVLIAVYWFISVVEDVIKPRGK